MGRRIDLVDTHGLGPANADYVLDSDRRAFPHQLTWASAVYSGPVTLTVTVVLKSRLGIDYDVELGTIDLTDATTAIFYGDDRMFLHSGDKLQLTAPDGGAGVTAAVQINEQVFP